MINEQIRDKEVRLIGPDGAQLGIVSSREAFAKAQEAGLDLVKIAPQAKRNAHIFEHLKLLFILNALSNNLAMKFFRQIDHIHHHQR